MNISFSTHCILKYIPVDIAFPDLPSGKWPQGGQIPTKLQVHILFVFNSTKYVNIFCR